MNTLVCSAISQQKILEFNYEGDKRKVEAFCYGLGTTGKELLRAFQIEGDSMSGNEFGWKLFNITLMTNIVITSDEHIGNRADYEPNDSAMELIYCNI